MSDRRKRSEPEFLTPTKKPIWHNAPMRSHATPRMFIVATITIALLIFIVAGIKIFL